MGTLTLTELKEEVKANLGNRADLDTRLTRFINRAQIEIAKEKTKFEELEVSEDKTLTYTGVPETDKVLAFSSLTNSNPHKIWSIRVIDGLTSWKLKYVANRKFDILVPNSAADAVEKPTHYTIWQRRFEWFRVINQAYLIRIRMSKWPTALSDASPSGLSDLSEKDDLIISKATALAFQSLGEKAKYDAWNGTYEDYLDKCIINDSMVPDAILTPTPAEDSSWVGGNYWADPFVQSVGGY